MQQPSFFPPDLLEYGSRHMAALLFSHMHLNEKVATVLAPVFVPTDPESQAVKKIAQSLVTSLNQVLPRKSDAYSKYRLGATVNILSELADLFSTLPRDYPKKENESQLVLA